VTGRFPWGDCTVVGAAAITGKAADLPGQPSASLSALGSTVLTAYVGVSNELKVSKDHTVVVTGAAGAVGSAAVQYAKNVIGAKRVVGIAGGPDKCAWVKSLGADDCIDYKAPDFEARLQAALPDGADKAYDNVGGEVLDALFTVINPHGVIGVCGLISGYNGQPQAFKNMINIITKRFEIHGFTLFDHVPEFGAAAQKIAGFIKDGKVNTTHAETVVHAPVDKIPETWALLFAGKSRGKLIKALTG
jgi:NADPH-dependent curcumin reductase CurA